MISLVLGKQGSGKTLYLVKKAYEYYKKGKKVYSNVHLKFKYEPLEYKKIVDCVYQDCVIIIDEGHLLLSSRNSMSKTSRSIVDGFISMCRKKKVHVLFSTQMERKIDVRIREEKDILIEAEKWAYKRGGFYKPNTDNDLDKRIPVLIKLRITELYSERSIVTSFKANDLFKMYDTNQIIKVVGLDE